MITKEDLLEIIKEREAKNPKGYKKIYISNTWYKPQYVFDSLDKKVFKQTSEEKGWLVVIHRRVISNWANSIDYLIVVDKDNIIEEIDADLLPTKNIRIEEIIL